MRETFPSQQQESDDATKLRLELLAELAEEIGEQRFVRAVKDAIKVSHRRWDCSVARVREMAGLKWTPPPSNAALAWEFVTQTFLNHCRTDGDGNYRLEIKVVRGEDELAKIIGVPEIPPPVKRAIQGLGGWAALAEAWPEYWSQKLRDFKDLYHEDESSPYRDRGLAELERVK